MPLFATVLLAPYRDGDQRGTTTFAAFRNTSTTSAAVTQTMARVAETRPGRQYDRPMAVSVEVPTWQLREAQQPGKSLYAVGITTTTQAPGIGETTDIKARIVVASDKETAQRQAMAEVHRQHPHDRQVGILTVTTTPDVIARAVNEWDRQQGRQQVQVPARSSTPTLATSQPGKPAGTLDVQDYAQKVVDTYRANLRHMQDSNSARYAAIYAHAERAAKDGRSTLRDAARVGDATLKSYDEARTRGTDHLVARREAAQAMAGRYDDRGRDTQRQARQQSYEMSR